MEEDSNGDFSLGLLVRACSNTAVFQYSYYWSRGENTSIATETGQNKATNPVATSCVSGNVATLNNKGEAYVNIALSKESPMVNRAIVFETCLLPPIEEVTYIAPQLSRHLIKIIY